MSPSDPSSGLLDPGPPYGDAPINLPGCLLVLAAECAWIYFLWKVICFVFVRL